VTLSQSPGTHTFCIDQYAFDDVDEYTYLDLTLSKNTTVHQKILIILGKALSTVQCLNKHIWKNEHSSIFMKLVFPAYFFIYQRDEQDINRKNQSSARSIPEV